MTKQDTEYLQKLYTLICGYLAKSRLSSKSKSRRSSAIDMSMSIPFILQYDDRRTKRTLRVLQEAGVPYTVDRRIEAEILQNIYANHAQACMSEPEFPMDLCEYYRNLSYVDSDEEMDTIGYSSNRFQDAEYIWIAEHRDAYDIKTSSDIFPKKLEALRVKNVLRAIVEMEIKQKASEYFAQLHILSYTKALRGTGQSYTVEDFGKLYECSLEAAQAYLKQYQDFLDLCQKKVNTLTKFCEDIARLHSPETRQKLRRAAIKNLKDRFLLHITVDEKEDEIASKKALLDMHTTKAVTIYKYMMLHEDIFNYEYLYGDEDIPLISVGTQDFIYIPEGHDPIHDAD